MIQFDDSHRAIFLPRYQSLVISMFRYTSQLEQGCDESNGLTFKATQDMLPGKEPTRRGLGDAYVYDIKWFDAQGRLGNKQQNMQVFYRIGSASYCLTTIGFNAYERPIFIGRVKEDCVLKNLPKAKPSSIPPPHIGISLPLPSNSNLIVSSSSDDYQNRDTGKSSDYQNRDKGKSSDYQNKFV